MLSTGTARLERISGNRRKNRGLLGCDFRTIIDTFSQWFSQGHCMPMGPMRKCHARATPDTARSSPRPMPRPPRPPEIRDVCTSGPSHPRAPDGYNFRKIPPKNAGTPYPLNQHLLRGRRLGNPASLVPEVFRPPRVAEGDRSTQVREARKLFARGVRSREAAVPRSTQAIHLFRGQPVWKPKPITAGQRGRSG